MTQAELNKTKVNLTCDRCNIDITLTYAHYQKTKDQSHYCTKCRGIVRKELNKNLPEDIKKRRHQTASKSISNGWAKMPAKRKEEFKDKMKEIWEMRKSI